MPNRGTMNTENMDMDEGGDTPMNSPQGPPMAHLFSMAGAAKACGVSRTTIRRRLEKGEFPNARQQEQPGIPESQWPWRIPWRDLTAAGLHPNRTDTAISDMDESMDDDTLTGTGTGGVDMSMSPGVETGDVGLVARLAALEERVRGMEERDRLKDETIAELRAAVEAERADKGALREDYRMYMRQLMPGQIEGAPGHEVGNDVGATKPAETARTGSGTGDRGEAPKQKAKGWRSFFGSGG